MTIGDRQQKAILFPEPAQPSAGCPGV